MAGEVVLIVDDTLANLKLARYVLLSAGYSVLTANNAEEALAMIEAQQPQLILMDLQLPGMSGLDCTRILKSKEATKDVVVVALTSYAMKGDAERATDAGCDGYLTKPIDTRTLAATVASYLRKQDLKDASTDS